MTDVRAQPAPATAEESRRNPHGSFIWYELMTPDPDGAKAFYEAVVPGWRVGPGSAEHHGYREINLDTGGHAGGLMPPNDEMIAGGAKPVWLGYIGVDDVDETVARIEAKGGRVHLPAFDIPAIGRIAMVTDPQGIPFYVMRGAIETPSDAFSPTAEGHVSWNELMTSDPLAAREFYDALFGWTSDDFMPMGENGEYRFFGHHGATIGAVCGEMGSGNSKWRYYIRVPSISAAVDAVKSGGGQVVMGPHEVPGGDHIIIGIDPQGAEFALVGKA